MGGFWIAESLTKVITASTTRITAAPAVQPISRRVLPWICAATAPLRLRNFHSVYTSAPSTATKITSAMYRMILYRLAMSSALREPPDWGVKNARWDARKAKARGFYSGRPGTRVVAAARSASEVLNGP